MQGETGNTFYIMFSGTVDVIKERPACSGDAAKGRVKEAYAKCIKVPNVPTKRGKTWEDKIKEYLN